MKKEQLNGLKGLIESLNVLRSSFTEDRFVMVECNLDEGLANKLVVECPYDTFAWELSLIVDRNSTICCEVCGKKVSFL